MSPCENPSRHNAHVSHARDYHQQPHNLQRKKNDGRKEHDTNLAHPFQSLVMCSSRGLGFGLPPWCLFIPTTLSCLRVVVLGAVSGA